MRKCCMTALENCTIICDSNHSCVCHFGCRHIPFNPLLRVNDRPTEASSKLRPDRRQSGHYPDFLMLYKSAINRYSRHPSSPLQWSSTASTTYSPGEACTLRL